MANIDYFPFGETRSETGLLGTDKKFTGQRLDGTGLYYYNARYYDPAIGRFISADSIVPNPADPQSLNRYSYCLNNPLRYIDPSGHAPWDWGKENIVDPVVETVTETAEDIGNAFTSFGATLLGNPRSQLSNDPIERMTGGRGSAAQETLTNQGRILVSQGTEDAIAQAYRSGDTGALYRAVGIGAAEVSLVLFGGAIIGKVGGKAVGWPGGRILARFGSSKATSSVMWKFGAHKSTAKWQSQMLQRGWTSEGITEAMVKGTRVKADNFVHPGNPATRYIHPSTGKSVVVDDITGEVIHVGGQGFRY